MVEPIDPFEGGVFHGIEAAPWATAVDDLCFEQAIDRFGQDALCHLDARRAQRRHGTKIIYSIYYEKYILSNQLNSNYRMYRKY